MMAFRWVGFRPYQPDKGAGKDYSQNKGKGKYQKGKGKEDAHPQSTLSASEAPEKEGNSHAWESDDWSASQWPDSSWTPAAGWYSTKAHTAWMAVHSLNLVHHLTRVVLDLGCTRSIGSRSAIERFQKHSWHYGITTEICRCNTSSMFAKSETETCLESCIIHFPTTPPCSTIVDELETSDVPFVFSLHQMRNLGTTIKLGPQGDKIICAAFGLFSFVEENFIMEHIVWDMTSLKHQPTAKSSDRPGHPRRHVTFAMSERKPAYPAHAPDMHEDEDEDDKPLARPATRKEPLEEGRDQAIEDEDHAPLVPPRPSRPLQTAQRQKKNGATNMAGSNCYTGTRGVKGLARASRGDLDFGQKGSR